MKKILSALLLIFAMLLSACGGVKYELKDGLMYDADGKEATGTFEFKTGKYKVKGNFVNGLPDGLFEEYYEDGSIMAKETFVNGEMTSKELYGNPLMIGNSNETTLYNENNEVISKLRDDDLTDIGATLKKLDDGTFELVKENEVIAKIDANSEIINYLYSTGETLLTVNDSTGETEFFFKNGNTFMKEKEGGSILNYRDGKPLYEIDGDSETIYNEEGDKIVGGFDLVTDIKKLD